MNLNQMSVTHPYMFQIMRELGRKLRERFTILIKKCWNISVKFNFLSSLSPKSSTTCSDLT